MKLSRNTDNWNNGDLLGFAFANHAVLAHPNIAKGCGFEAVRGSTRLPGQTHAKHGRFATHSSGGWQPQDHNNLSANEPNVI